MLNSFVLCCNFCACKCACTVVVRSRGGRLLGLGTRPPPPPPCPLGPLSYQGSIATGHTYGGAKGARKIFFIPLAHVASLPARAVEHPNAILEPNLDSNAHPNPSAHFYWGGGVPYKSEETAHPWVLFPRGGWGTVFLGVGKDKGGGRVPGTRAIVRHCYFWEKG